MFRSRIVQLFLIAFAVLYTAQARLSFPDIERRADDILAPVLGDSATTDSNPASLTSAAGSSSAPSATSVQPLTSSSSSEVPPTSSSSSQAPVTSAVAPPPSTSDTAPFTTPPPSSVPTTSSSSSIESSSSSSEEQSSLSKTHSIVVTTEFTVVTKTNSDGTKHTMTSAEEVTSTPSLNEGDGNDGNSSMSPKTRNTIIGVVVGVGGAVALGALAVVAYRIWGRKKHGEEGEAFMAYGNTGYEGIGGKSEPDGSNSIGQQSSPFQSTLEGYHGPNNGTVNHSHNF